MISREFIYEFSNFDDMSARENDIFVRPHDIFRCEMGVRCSKVGLSHIFGVVCCR